MQSNCKWGFLCGLSDKNLGFRFRFPQCVVCSACLGIYLLIGRSAEGFSLSIVVSYSRSVYFHYDTMANMVNIFPVLPAVDMTHDDRGGIVSRSLHRTARTNYWTSIKISTYSSAVHSTCPSKTHRFHFHSKEVALLRSIVCDWINNTTAVQKFPC